ncbi:pyridoxal-phosphate dependent enzyme [Kitasatospora sp. NBC_01287]|uniref:PLP-dependent cysteine synthase family protein n=1 Tax=Kitasatospora sp. NBC_01287 TaxID=2903573 RepID=UPI00224F0C92|nr:pyridoxal-phosphate dependent enzyme [Kitasatospora sp. NBC_01287]MCX4744206.1 pyridoxal-phosphate dependent enzyme [Kitasatospora sp. NBC_01287]
MDAHESLIELIGNTPLVRLRTPGAEGAAVYAKLEYLSAGGSVKDRIGLRMIEEAEKSGALRPGGTVVEATSGNTGAGLAMVAAAKGYRTVVVLPDKSSAEKIATLRAYGAEVVVRPGGLPAHDPEHILNVAARLAESTPGGWFAGQYGNPANPAAHYLTTGPEIWRQTEGRVTHLVSCVGTGGTISGTGRFLKEASGGAVRVIGADPASSVYSGGDGRPYFVEAAGRFRHPETVEDVWPDSYQQDVVDEILPIADRDALLTIRRLAREEGLLVGGSAGTAVSAALRVAAGLGPRELVVVILPDSGRQYLSKYFNDEWMLRQGFLDGDPGAPRVGDAVPAELRERPLPYLHHHRTVEQALDALRARQREGAEPVLPVGPAPVAPGRQPTSVELLGAVGLEQLTAALARGTAAAGDPIADHLAPPLPRFGTGEPAGAALAELAEQGGRTAVVVHDGHGVGLIGTAELRALVDQALSPSPLG